MLCEILFLYVYLGVATVGGRIYMVGGNDGTAFLNTCEVYDPISDRWSNIAPMNTARAGIGCAVQDGILYAAGYFLSFTSAFCYFVVFLL